MPYRFIENEVMADVAIEVSNETLTDLFRDSGEALIKTMIENTNDISSQTIRLVVLEHEHLDLLLYNFLEQFIYFKDTDQLLLNTKKILIKKTKNIWKLKATLSGEKLDSTRHRQIVDVKAVTFHQLSLYKDNNIWKAHFILDV